MCRPAVYPERRSRTRSSSCPGRAKGAARSSPVRRLAKQRRKRDAPAERRGEGASRKRTPACHGRHFCHPERSSGHWHKSVLEDEIPRAPALGDTLGLVEGPVDTEVDAALAVLFLGLGERREATRGERAHVPLVVSRHAVEFVRHEGEGDVVGPVEVAQDLERSEEHTSELQSRSDLVCRLLLEKKKKKIE